jgi:hypothetical protein
MLLIHRSEITDPRGIVTIAVGDRYRNVSVAPD